MDSPKFQEVDVASLILWRLQTLSHMGPEMSPPPGEAGVGCEDQSMRLPEPAALVDGIGCPSL